MFSASDDYGVLVPNLFIDGKPVNYPVVNQRESRAAAGLILLITASSFFTVLYMDQYWLWYLVVPLLFWELLLKVLFAPNAGPLAMVASLMVSGHDSIWVPAMSKRFAWFLSLIVVILMMISVLVLSMIPWLTLGLCLILVLTSWMEVALDVSLGQVIYHACVRVGWVEAPPSPVMVQETSTVGELLNQG